MPKAIGGLDNQNQRLQNVATPTASTDGVPKSFIRYDIGITCIGKPAASEVVGHFVSPVAFTIPQNLAGSLGRALTAATASAVWTLSIIPAGTSTETTIGTFTFAASGTVASLSTQAARAVAVGDVLRLKAPSTVDSTLADISFTLAGAR